jgi:hypothetical protein
VLVIGDPDRDLVDDAAQRVEERIGMPVQATVRTYSQWRSERGSFIREVKSRPLVVVCANGEQEPIGELLELEASGDRSALWAGNGDTPPAHGCVTAGSSRLSHQPLSAPRLTVGGAAPAAASGTSRAPTGGLAAPPGPVDRGWCPSQDAAADQATGTAIAD